LSLVRAHSLFPPLIILLPIPEEIDAGVLSPHPLRLKLSGQAFNLVLTNIAGETRADIERQFSGVLKDFKAVLPADHAAFVLQWIYVGRNPEIDLKRIKVLVQRAWAHHCTAAVLEVAGSMCR